MRQYFQFAFGRRTENVSKFIIVPTEGWQSDFMIEFAEDLKDTRLALLCAFLAEQFVSCNDIVEEVPFIEFFTDIVQLQNLSTDSRRTFCSETGINYTGDVMVESTPESIPMESQKLVQALTGLGFKKPDVNQFVSSVNLRDPLPDLIKRGIQKLS